MDRRSALIGTLAATLGASVRASADTPALPAGPAEIIALWPNGAPGMPTVPPPEELQERSKNPAIPDRALLHIARPRMAVFRAANPNGAAVLVMPGGGYRYVVVDKEGYELAAWLAARGVTAFVLFYRLPGDGWAAGPDVALTDAQRAMRLVRSRAQAFGVDPARVAAMGFSAGGHLCADLATRHDASVYAAVDAADALSAKPRLAALLYPVMSMTAPIAHAGSREQLIGKAASRALEDAHSPQLHVGTDTPPCFLCAADDDTTVPVENSLMFHAALKAAKVPAELHLFGEGGHGFGLRGVVGKPAAVWPELFLGWARSQGLVQGSAP
jgi:acetyl esterase/lipase